VSLRASASSRSARRPKAYPARKGIKTTRTGPLPKYRVRRPKAYPARKGIKTFTQSLQTDRLLQPGPKAYPARKGIKTT